MLEANIIEYQNTKKFVWSNKYVLTIPNLKKQHQWLKDIPSQALQQKCMDLDRALKMTAKSRSKRFGFPKFKSKHSNTQSLRIPQTNGHIKPSKKQIQIPKIGCIRWIRHRPIEGKLKNITIKRQNNRWWCVVLCEILDIPKLPINKNTTVGIDLGLTTFAVLSDGTEISTPRYYRSKQQKLKRAQQQLAKKQRASANRRKAIAKLGRIHEKIRN